MLTYNIKNKHNMLECLLKNLKKKSNNKNNNSE